MFACLQSGKTHTLTVLVPALAAVHPLYGVGKPQELIVWSLDMSTLSSAQVWNGKSDQSSFCSVLNEVLAQAIHELTSALSFAAKRRDS
jgi:hypothetical protein